MTRGLGGEEGAGGFSSSDLVGFYFRGNLYLPFHPWKSRKIRVDVKPFFKNQVAAKHATYTEIDRITYSFSKL